MSTKTDVGNLAVVISGNAAPLAGTIAQSQRHLSQFAHAANNVQIKQAAAGGNAAAGRGGGAAAMAAAGAVGGVAGATAMGALSAAASVLTGTLSGVTTALSAAGETAVRSAMDYQDAAVAFEVMTGNAVKGRDLLRDLQSLAVATPFGSSDLIQNARMLMGMGIATEAILPSLSRLGDLAAGDAFKLQRLALAYGQVVAKGRLMGGELLQFTEAGIGVGDFAAAAGVSLTEFRARLEAGKVSAEVATDALNKLTSAGGRFYQMNAKASQTVRGQFNALSESVVVSLQKVGMGSFDKLNVAGRIGQLADLLGSGAVAEPLMAVNREVARTGQVTTQTVRELEAAGVGVREFATAAGVSVGTLLGQIERGEFSAQQFRAAFGQLDQVQNTGPGVLERWGSGLVEALGKAQPLLDNAVAYIRVLMGMAEDFGRKWLEQSSSMDGVRGQLRVMTQVGIYSAAFLAAGLLWVQRRLEDLLAITRFLTKQFGMLAVSMTMVASPTVFADAMAMGAKWSAEFERLTSNGADNLERAAKAADAIPKNGWRVNPEAEQLATKVAADMKQGSDLKQFMKQRDLLKNAMVFQKDFGRGEYEFGLLKAFDTLEDKLGKATHAKLPEAALKGSQEAEKVIARALQQQESPMKRVEAILREALKAELATAKKMSDLYDAFRKLEIKKADILK